MAGRSVNCCEFICSALLRCPRMPQTSDDWSIKFRLAITSLSSEGTMDDLLLEAVLCWTCHKEITLIVNITSANFRHQLQQYFSSFFSMAFWLFQVRAYEIACGTAGCARPLEPPGRRESDRIIKRYKAASLRWSSYLSQGVSQQSQSLSRRNAFLLIMSFSGSVNNDVEDLTTMLI